MHATDVSSPRNYLTLSVSMVDGGAYLNPKVQIDFFPGLGYGLKSTEVRLKTILLTCDCDSMYHV